jgi:hypothetical protein
MRRKLLLLLFVSLGYPLTAGADPVILYSNLYSNLGAGDAYDASVSYALEDDVTKEYAMQFRPTVDGILGQVRLPILVVADPEFEGRKGGAELSFTLTQASLAEGGPEGELIERWVLGQNEVNEILGTTFLTLNSQTGAMLSADVTYYLSGRFLSSGFALWYGSPDTTGFVFERIDGGSHEESEGGWNPLGFERLAAFEIAGGDEAPVPEPATMLLVGGGLAAAIRRRRQTRANSPHPSAHRERV